MKNLEEGMVSFLGGIRTEKENVPVNGIPLGRTSEFTWAVPDR